MRVKIMKQMEKKKKPMENNKIFNYKLRFPTIKYRANQMVILNKFKILMIYILLSLKNINLFLQILKNQGIYQTLKKFKF